MANLASEDARIIRELQATGPEGRPATPVQPALSLEERIRRVAEPLATGFGDIAAGMRGESAAQFPSRQIERQRLEEGILRAKAPSILVETARLLQGLGLSDEQALKAAQGLSQSATEMQFDLPPEVFVQAMRNPGGIEALAAKFPEILKLPPESRAKLLTDPGFLKTFLGLGPEDRPKADFERVGLELFGKATGFTAEEAAKINKTIQERRVEVSAATGAEAVKTKAGKELVELEPILNIVESVKSFANQIITAKTGPEAIAQGARLHAGVISRTNAPAAAYQEGRQAFLGVLARALGGERGVLTDRDIKRVDGMLPGFFDTEEIKRIKLGLLDNAVDTAMNAKRKLAEGKSTPEQARAEVAARIEQLMKKVPKTKQGFGSAEEVRAAFKRGDITQKDAAAILKEQFGFNE